MIALGATKFSIILLYWRMFPIWSYKIPLYILGATTLGLTIGSVGSLLSQL